MARSPSRWTVAAASSFMNACQTGAFFFTPTTLMPIIVRDFQIPLSLSTVPIAVGKVSYVFLLIPGGVLVDNVGPRKTVLVGVFILALSMLLYAALANTFALLIVFHIAMAASAAVSGVPVFSIFIAQWFTKENIGLAMGLVLAGYSAAGTLFPMILGPIADSNGWRYSMSVMAFTLLLLALPVSYFFLLEKPDDNDAEQQQQHSQPPRHQLPPQIPLSSSNLSVGNYIHAVNSNSQLLPNPSISEIHEREVESSKFWAFVGFSMSYLLLQYCNGCFLENIMFYLSIDRNMSLASASIFFSALNLAAFLAKIVGGHLGDRYDRFYVAAAASALCSIAIAFLFVGGPGLDENYFPELTTYEVPIMVFAILYGFGYGASFNSLYALVPIIFGKKNLGQTQSTFFGIGLAGNAAGSVVTSILRAKYGTYQKAFILSFFSCICNFIVFNITRVAITGTLFGSKELDSQDPLSCSTSGFFAGVDQLDADEEAVRLRLGDWSDTGTDTRMSQQGSIPNFYSQGNIIPSSESLTNGIHTQRFPTTPRSLSFLNTETPEASPRTGNEFIDSPPIHTLGGGVDQRRAFIRYPESGMVPNRGYPIPRDWSSHSLRRTMPSIPDLSPSIVPPPTESTAATAASSAIPIPSMGVRKSSTLEALIDSGILSASFESIGYLGKKSTLGNTRPNRNPPVRRSSFVNGRRNIQSSLSRSDGISQSYGATTSTENISNTANPDDDTTTNE